MSTSLHTPDAADADVLAVERRFRELAASADEIVALAADGQEADAVSRLVRRNAEFEAARQALEALPPERRGAHPGLAEALHGAWEAQERLVTAVSDALARVRREMAEIDRGASARSAYERSAAGPAPRRMDLRH